MMFLVRVILIMCGTIYACKAQCNNYDPYALFKEYSSAMDNYNECIFNASIMNISCIDQHCPRIRLSGKCPLDENKQLDSKKVKEINRYLMDCFSEASNICGISVTKLPLPVITLDLAEALFKIPFIAINCSSYHDATKWVISNFTRTKINIVNAFTQRNKSYIKINTHIKDMYYTGETSCHVFFKNPFKFLKNLFLFGKLSKAILKIINAGINWIRPDVGFQYRVNVSTNSFVNIDDVKIKPTSKSTVRVRLTLTKLFPLEMDKWLQGIDPLRLVTKSVENIWKKGNFPLIFSKFLGAYAAYGLQLALQNCPIDISDD